MHCGKKVMNSIIRRPLYISFKSWLLLAPFGRPAAKSSRFKSWMKYSRRKNLHCFLKETMSFITYSASTKNELWTLFGLAQVRVKTSCFIPRTLVGQKLFSGKKNSHKICQNLWSDRCDRCGTFGRSAAKSSRFKSWMKYSRRKNLHCFLKETMSFITYSASTKNELWTLFGLAQVRVKTSCFIPRTLVGQKLFSGKKNSHKICQNLWSDRCDRCGTFGRSAAKSSRFKSWMKYSRRKNLHCFLKETMSFITYSASTKNELWTLFGLAQVRVKTSCFIPRTLVGQKLFSGKKNSHKICQNLWSDRCDRCGTWRIQFYGQWFSNSNDITTCKIINRLIAGMESKPCWRVFFLIRQINGRIDYILGKTTTYKINMY